MLVENYSNSCRVGTGSCPVIGSSKTQKSARSDDVRSARWLSTCASQRSFHIEPVFRLLLKAAVMGAR